MFKAKLIKNQEYYQLRSKQLWLILLPSIPIGLLANFFMFPWWATVLIVAAYILILIYITRNQKLMNSMLGTKRIEIDHEEIRIKSARGNLEEAISLSEVDHIVLQKEYGLPQETMKDITKEITGNPKKNCLIIHYKNEERKFDFEIESHYMINQLNKIIETWSKNGLKIEKV